MIHENALRRGVACSFEHTMKKCLEVWGYRKPGGAA